MMLLRVVSFHSLLDGFAERFGVYLGITVKFAFDGGKQFKQSRRLNQTTLKQPLDVCSIKLMLAFKLCQGLRIKIIVVKRELAFLLNKLAALLPTRQRRNKIVRRSQFDIDLQLLLQPWQSAKDFVAFRNDFQVQIDC